MAGASAHPATCAERCHEDARLRGFRAGMPRRPYHSPDAVLGLEYEGHTLRSYGSRTAFPRAGPVGPRGRGLGPLRVGGGGSGGDPRVAGVPRGASPITGVRGIARRGDPVRTAPFPGPLV